MVNNKNMIVYKYRPVDKYTLELLINNEFHLSFPEDFNDPFDSVMRSKFEGTLEDYIRLYEKSNIPFDKDTFLKEISDGKKYEEIKDIKGFLENDPEYFRKLKKMRVSCFTCKNDNILMWSHYSNCHKGVVLGFETSKINDSNMLYFEEIVNALIPFFPNNSYPLFKVKYDKIPDSYNVIENDHSKLVEFVITKSPDWIYEQEYRLIFLDDMWKKNKVRFLKQVFKEITFGLCTSEEDKKTIRKIVQDNYISQGYDVKFFQCERKKDEYGLDIVPA